MKNEIYLILDNIRSRENVGSIFRTADGVGVSKIYLCGITPTPSVVNPKFEILNQSTQQVECVGRALKFKCSDPKQYQNSKSEIQNSDKIAKTALGAEKYIPWEHYKQTYRCLLIIKNQNSKIKIVGLEQTKTSQNIFKFKPKFPLALIVGNEVKGISPKILKYCDKKIAIPMYGLKESLNVSVATGVALYTLLCP